MVSSIKGHNIVTKYIDKESYVLDLGANKGDFAQKLYGLTKARIFSVEPCLDNYNRIPKLGENVKMNVAVSELSKKYFLTLNENSESNALYEREPVDCMYCVVEGVTFSEIISRNQIDKLSLLKMDIEGTEIKVLKSIPQPFLKKVKQITIEFHDFIGDGIVTQEDVTEICNYLKHNGFSVIKFSPLSNKDVLFLNNSDFSKSEVILIKTIYRLRYWVALTISKLFNGDL